MIHVGVDIIEIERFKEIEGMDRFLDKVFTKPEQEAMQGAPSFIQYVASRFAVKEAVIKALPEPINWLDMEVHKTEEKKVQVRFLNTKYDNYHVAVSLSHTEKSVIGFAIGYDV